MSWMNKLERKWGRYAIPNMNRYLVLAIAIGYVIRLIVPSVLEYLDFSANAILHGQVWRLLTWIFSMPPSGNVFLVAIFLLCLIPMGQTLESFIGTFQMNVYIIGGILLSDIGGLLVYAFTRMPVYLSTYYILLSMFMALAICIPEAEVRIWFVLPIKMKWMLFIYIVDLAYEVYTYFRAGFLIGIPAVGFVYSTEVVFAILNLVLFFVCSKPHLSRRQRKRRKEFRSQIQFHEPRPGSGIARHKCAICGRTELDDPNLNFRYCSKCAGNYEYCEDHIFTHQHIRTM